MAASENRGDEMSALSKQLIKLREQRNWSQNAIAKRLDISHHTYIKHEKDERMPRLETLIKLRDIYGVSMDYLLGLTSNDAVTVEITNLTPEQRDCIQCVVNGFVNLNKYENVEF